MKSMAKWTSLLFVASISLMFSLASLATVPEPAKPVNTAVAGSDDRAFVEQALHSGQMEVAMARIAQEKAADQSVKETARMLEREHEELNRKLQGLLTTAPGASSQGTLSQAQIAAANADMKTMQELQGDRFDSEYVAMMVMHHNASILKFEEASNNEKLSAGVKQLALDALPTLRRHAAAAQGLQASLAAR
ncbi:DUF4142 domain-containing protein [Arenimonas sp.]|uniref:DUF4142 domain-containing protein n=1 Tax=Arenimonas sp. TaxID=1872635 RepID=UPI0039E5D7FE